MPSRIIALSALAVTLVGCGLTPQEVRKATYPQSFQYLTKGEIQGTMTSLAWQVRALNEVMEGEARDREQVARILGDMRGLAAQLSATSRSNHPRLDEFAPRLQEDIDRALLGVRFEPPDYYYAGVVSGSCEYCHAVRHEPATR